MSIQTCCSDCKLTYQPVNVRFQRLLIGSMFIWYVFLFFSNKIRILSCSAWKIKLSRFISVVTGYYCKLTCAQVLKSCLFDFQFVFVLDTGGVILFMGSKNHLKSLRHERSRSSRALKRLKQKIRHYINLCTATINHPSKVPTFSCLQ